MPLVLILILILPSQARKPEPKKPPVLLYPTPLAVAPGAKAKLTLRGLRLEAVTELKTGDPRAKATLVGKPKKSDGPANYLPERVGDSEVEIELDLPKDFPAGTVELTAVGPDGTSAPYRLIVDGRRTVETEPNEGFDQARPLTVPAAVDAVIGRGQDVDVFRFEGKAGQKLRIEVAAARLGSPVDALLVLYDADRQILDSCDDTPDGAADPVLAVTLPRDGVYYLSVIDAHDSGGPLFPYRLLVSPVK